ncbi:hypothetical protein, partial [Neisseria sp. P0008.S004]|uniref:hypothetical protein n=1 Tax=Neisseria sp. P0008.S004 TaxID=3436701 RepID=UPI003F810513
MPPLVQVFIATAHTKPPINPNRQTVQPLGGIYGTNVRQAYFFTAGCAALGAAGETVASAFN